MKDNGSTELGSIATSGTILVAFQIAALAIPLLTLPFLARALGIVEFGRIMLAQAIVFFGVVFVDAGFNTESQRQVALATDTRQSVQVLYENVVTRFFCSLPVIAAILIFANAFNDLPFLYIVAALLHVLGTIAFPQWWLIGRKMAFTMGLASTAGRLVSAACVLAFVHEPRDGLVAIVAVSSGTLVSGILVSAVTLGAYRKHSAAINTGSWRHYFRSVRPTIASGFFASATASLPIVFLGWAADFTQVGLYSAADRLTRAAAYVAGALEQSAMRPLAQTEARDIVLGQRLRKKLMLLLGFWAGLACAIAIWLAPTAIAIIYGDQFAHVVPVFRLLCLWLWLYVMRRAGLLFTWSLRGQLRAVSRFQWLEAMVITAAAAIGASCHGAVGLATALIAGEILLATVLCTAWHRQHAALVR